MKITWDTGFEDETNTAKKKVNSSIVIPRRGKYSRIKSNRFRGLAAMTTETAQKDYFTNLISLIAKETDSSFKVSAKLIPYNNGGIIEIIPEEMENNIIETLPTQNDIFEALNKINSHLDKIMPPDLLEDFEVSNNQTNFFKGTSILFNENKIFLIKDFQSCNWNKNSATKDFNTIKNFIKKLAD